MKRKSVAAFCLVGIATLASITFYSYAYAQGEKDLHWYEVTIIHGSAPYEFYGSSALSNDEFVAELGKQKFVRLDNLMFRTKSVDKTKSFPDASIYRNWKEWDPIKKTYIYLNVGSVIAVQPLEKNPISKK